MKPTLTEQDFQEAAQLLNVDIPAIKAVAEVESRGAGFLPDGRPKILFERHVFHRLTNGVWDGNNPGISNKRAGGYGQAGEWQHERLDRAAKLHRSAALQSASWGKFQIMGFNYEAAGFDDLQSFINAMYKSEGEHLKAFCNFVISNGLADELRNHEWARFARRYNGENYRINKYDEKLAAAYKRHGEKR